MKMGTQIAYIPNHANGDIHHKDVEFGFVTEESIPEIHFCRYWSKVNPNELRTLSCSEATPTKNLVEHKSVPQHIIDHWLGEVRL
jgi:hypothetical protein